MPLFWCSAAVICLSTAAEVPASPLMPAATVAPGRESSPAPQAKSQSGLLDRAAALIRAGHFVEAEQALELAARKPGSNPTAIDFHRGLLAQARGDYLLAAEIFQRILVDQPGLFRVRLELARALFSAQRDSAAQRHFERVLDAHPPDVVARNIQRFLDTMRRRRAWRTNFAFLLLPDSNVNRAPSTRIVNIGGLPFRLSDAAQEKSGVGAYLSLGGQYRWPLGRGDNGPQRDDGQRTSQARWRLLTSAQLSRRDYPGRALDDTNLEFTVGPRRLFSNGEAGAALFGNWRYYGKDPYSRETGLRLDVSRLLTPRDHLLAHLEASRLEHDADKTRDGPQYTYGLQWRHGLHATRNMRMWFRYRYERTRVGWMRNRAPNLGAGYYHDFSRGISIGVEAQAIFSDFEQKHPIFAIKRRDRTWVGTIRLGKRDFKFFGLTPALSLTHIRSDSTIEFYRYRRNLMEIGLRRVF